MLKLGRRGETPSEYLKRKANKRYHKFRASPFFYIFSACLPISSRLRIIHLLLTRKLGAPEKIREISLSEGSIFLDINHLPDWQVFYGIFNCEEYPMDYQGALVIDIGAHKGFLSAYALNNHASHVHMYEPAPTNTTYLEKLIHNYSDDRLVLYQEGISDQKGELNFYIYAESWSHSLVNRSDKEPISVETVQVISLNEAIFRALQKSKKIVVKIDAEGAEEKIIMATDTESLQKVDEIWVEVHKYAKVDFEKVIEHLAKANLVWKNPKKLNEYSHHLLHFAR